MSQKPDEWKELVYHARLFQQYVEGMRLDLRAKGKRRDRWFSNSVENFEKDITLVKKYDRIVNLPQVSELERALKIARRKPLLGDKFDEAFTIIEQNYGQLVAELVKMAQELRTPPSNEEIDKLTGLVGSYLDLKDQYIDLLDKASTTSSSYVKLASQFKNLLDEIKEIDTFKVLDSGLQIAETRFDEVFENETDNPRINMKEGIDFLDTTVRSITKEYNISDQMVDLKRRVLIQPQTVRTSERPIEQKIEIVPKYEEQLIYLAENAGEELLARARPNRPVQSAYDTLQKIDKSLMEYLYGTAAERGYSNPDEEGKEIEALVISTKTQLKQKLDDLLTPLQVEVLGEVAAKVSSYAKSRKLSISN